MRISDWSSDVCSSDLSLAGRVSGFAGDRSFDHAIRHDRDGWRLDGVLADGLGHLADLDYGFTPATNLPPLRRARLKPEIGRASCRGRVSVRVDLGGRRFMKNNKIVKSRDEEYQIQ